MYTVYTVSPSAKSICLMPHHIVCVSFSWWNLSDAPIRAVTYWYTSGIPLHCLRLLHYLKPRCDANFSVTSLTYQTCLLFSIYCEQLLVYCILMCSVCRLYRSTQTTVALNVVDFCKLPYTKHSCMRAETTSPVDTDSTVCSHIHI